MKGSEEVIVLLDKFTMPVKFNKVEVSTQTYSNIEKIIILTKFKTIENSNESTTMVEENNGDLETNTVSKVQQLYTKNY